MARGSFRGLIRAMGHATKNTITNARHRVAEYRVASTRKRRDALVAALAIVGVPYHTDLSRVELMLLRADDAPNITTPKLKINR